MDIQHVTRRALLKASPIILATIALPSAIATASDAARPSAVLGAIALHKTAKRELDRACNTQSDIEEELQATAGYEWRPGVQCGFYRHGDERDPVFAHSHEQLDELCEQQCGPVASIWGPAGVEKTRARYAEHHRALTRLIRRKNALERAVGLPAATKAVRDAYVAEEHSAVALMLAAPANEAEAKTKRNYMRGKDAFRPDWWDNDGLFAALLANCPTKAGA